MHPDPCIYDSMIVFKNNILHEMQSYLVNKFGRLKTLSSKYKLLSCNGQAAYKTQAPAGGECSAAPRKTLRTQTGVPSPVPLSL